jgi:HEAT repeat protein
VGAALLLAAFLAGPLLVWQLAFERGVQRQVEELALPEDAPDAEARRARAAAELDELLPEALPAVIACFAVTEGPLQRGVTLQRSGLAKDAGPLVVPAMAWLRDRPDPATVGALVDALADDNHDVRHFAGLTLAWIGRPAVPALIETLRRGVPARRAAAAFALSFMGAAGTDALPALREALAHPDKDVHLTARYAIQQLSPGNEGFWELVEKVRQVAPR